MPLSFPLFNSLASHSTDTAHIMPVAFNYAIRFLIHLCDSHIENKGSPLAKDSFAYNYYFVNLTLKLARTSSGTM